MIDPLDAIELRAQARQGWPETADIRYLISRVRELEGALADSEEWRKAYQQGKHALYAMGGEAQQAAMDHLPCNESALDSRFTRLLEMPRLKAKDEEIARLREALAFYADERNYDERTGAAGKFPRLSNRVLEYGQVPFEHDRGDVARAALSRDAQPAVLD